MAKYAQTGKDFAYKINFVVDGQPVQATSATMTVTRNDGTIVGDFDEKDLTIPPEGYAVTEVIEAADNTASVPNELRYIEVAFVFNDQTYFLRDYYMLRANMNFPLTVDEIRAVLGADGSEIPDSWIDIFAAYAAVQADVPDTNLDNILSSGSDLLPTLIAAVKYKAAMGLIGSAQSAMFQSEQADNTLYKRFAKIDFTGLQNTLAGQYSAALLLLAGNTTGGTTPTLAIVTAETDYITGQ